MPSDQRNHNANLPNTLPNRTPIVNLLIKRDEEGEIVGYDVKNAPAKLFVNIDNNIYKQGLTLRQVEFYCQLMYLIISYPKIKLSILKIQSLIFKYTGKKKDKNTINTYLNTLLSKGLLFRAGPYLIAPKIGSNYDPSNIFNDEVKSNIYQAPKVCFTTFYITSYNSDTISGLLTLELYLASKYYKFHRPSLVCKELNISRKTYYKLLKELLNKNIVTKTKRDHKTNFYTNTDRTRLKEETRHIQSDRETDRDYEYQLMRAKRREAKLKRQQNQTEHSRLWFGSPMGKIMKEFKVNYIQAFEGYDPFIAYEIVQVIKEQYGSNLTAPLIVSAIKNNYNGIRITDRKHEKFKRDQARFQAYQQTDKGFLEYMES